MVVTKWVNIPTLHIFKLSVLPLQLVRDAHNLLFELVQTGFFKSLRNLGGISS